ncbi:hypothetical protein [Streptomyces sp. NPDC005262]|uniref:hypothetical protein n=1 Tax=Streptomyces sp. NPDC005262 TaxID=3364710 RepID=UPI00369DDB48
MKHPQLHAVHLKAGPGLVELGRIEAAHVVCRPCVPVARDRNVQGLRQPLHGDPVSCARDPSAEAGEGVEDLLGGLGPDERLGVFVPVLDPCPDIGFQSLDVLVCATTDHLVGQLAEPPLDLVDPR